MKKRVVSSFIALVLSIIISSAVSGIHLAISLPDDFELPLGNDFIEVPETIQEEDLEVSVMSFNVRLIAKEDNKQDYWTNRKEPMIKLLNSYGPDIIGFQEVTHPQYRYLIERLGDEYSYFGLSRSGMGLFRGDMVLKSTDPEVTLVNRILISIIDEASVIFFRKSRFELLDASSFWLSQTPDKPSKGWDASHKRICSYVQLKDHYTGESFGVFNTHMDHIGWQARENSVNLMIEKAHEQGDDIFITMGDFNFPEGHELYDNIMAEGTLSDSKYLAPQEMSDDGPTYNGFGKSSREEPIDFILVTEEYLDVKSYQILTDKYSNNNYISDHYPVFVRFGFK